MALCRPGQSETKKPTSSFALKHLVALFSSFLAFFTSLSHSPTFLSAKTRRNLIGLWPCVKRNWKPDFGIRFTASGCPNLEVFSCCYITFWLHRLVFHQTSAKYDRIMALRLSGRGGTGKLSCAFALQHQFALYSSFFALVMSLSHSTVLFYTKNQRNLSRLRAGAGQSGARLENLFTSSLCSMGLPYSRFSYPKLHFCLTPMLYVKADWK